jgi:hypothetical protein
MNLRLNRNLFMQTDADSAGLGMLATIVHRPRETGDYAGTVYRGEQQVGDFSLRVLEDDSPLSVQIDLAGQSLPGEGGRHAGGHEHDCGCADEGPANGGRPAAQYTVGRGGYVVFHVSSGAGGYAVQLAGPMGASMLERRDESERGRGDVWSSRELQSGDLFAVTLLRPGTYSVSNQNGGEGKMRMLYPERGRTAYRPPEPLRIAVSDGRLEPAGFELQPMQGQVYEIQAPARITVTLVEPEDREEPAPPDRRRPARYSLRRRLIAPG